MKKKIPMELLEEPISEDLQEACDHARELLHLEAEKNVQAERDLAVIKAILKPQRTWKRWHLPVCYIKKTLYVLVHHEEKGDVIAISKHLNGKTVSYIREGSISSKYSNPVKLELCKYLSTYLRYATGTDEEAAVIEKEMRKKLISECPYKTGCPFHGATNITHCHCSAGGLQNRCDKEDKCEYCRKPTAEEIKYRNMPGFVDTEAKKGWGSNNVR